MTLNNIIEAKLKTIKAVLDCLPSETMLTVSKKTGMSEAHIHNIIKEMKKSGWVTYEKVGRSNKIKLLNKSKKLKEALNDI